MTDNQTDDDRDILNEPDPLPPEAEQVSERGDSEEDILSPIPTGPAPAPSNDSLEVEYPTNLIDFRGESVESLAELLKQNEAELGASTLDTKVKEVGSWENLIYRALDPEELSAEEMRIQDALALFKKNGEDAPTSVLRNENGTIVLRTSRVGQKLAPGETKIYSGADALLAFESPKTGGGGYRVPLFNSGICLDIAVPTGINIQTMMANFLIVDRQLGSQAGAHYFAYNDVMYKTQILNFLQPLIRNSSYTDWNKNNRLWSIIKLPDLASIVAHLAALCHREGFEGYVTRCTRPEDDGHKLCRHTETLTVDIFKMIMTRYSTLSKSSIDHMTQARLKVGGHNLSQITKYQADLGLEGERITFDDLTFVMRIPTVAEHLESGQVFIQNIVNEIAGDNTEGRYEQFGLRYIRTFTSWISMVERQGEEGRIFKTAEREVIVRALERLVDQHGIETISDKLRGYIDKVQLTYVGYPVTPCPACGYVADTPSGMYTVDPFTSFFIQAYMYSIQALRSPPQA